MIDLSQFPGIDSATLKVGMEIHVELATRTKMFTAARSVAHPDHLEAEPNTLLDPVVVGMPGTLPVLNRAAIEMAMRVGLALNCEIARFTKWDRKGYYYPDLPKSYQISQYDLPLCGPGWLEVAVDPEDGGTGEPQRIGIVRAHLEEDAGKLLHEAPGGIAIDHSIVDLNRAGTPLLEIVTEPDLTSPEQCVAFARKLHNLCIYHGVTVGDMQRGHMRFEPNINVVIAKGGETYATPIVEIKNLNSFRAVRGAVAYEYQRQIEAFVETGEVMGERAKTTRGWDDARGVTTLQRHKEDADEYRYFPDPDLVPVTVDVAWIDKVRSDMKPAPDELAEQWIGMGVDRKDTALLIGNAKTAADFAAVIECGDVPPPQAAKLFNNNLARIANERSCAVHELDITPDQIRGVMKLSADDKISSSGVDQLLAVCCDEDGEAEQLAEKHDLLQVSDTGALEAMVVQIIADEKNAKAVEDIRGGKDKAIGALMGQIMKMSKGQANPKMVTQLIKSKLQG